MKKKQTTPKQLTVSFDEGKKRVKTMVDEMYEDIISDNISELQECKSITYDDYRLAALVDSLQMAVKEHSDIQKDVDKCFCLGDIVDLSKKYCIFDGVEEMLVGAFLGQIIIILE